MWDCEEEEKKWIENKKDEKKSVMMKRTSFDEVEEQTFFHYSVSLEHLSNLCAISYFSILENLEFFARFSCKLLRET